jgi:hypothetical protein
MKKIYLLSIIILCFVKAFAQRETFDQFSFSPIKDWKKETKDNLLYYSIKDQKKNTWCQIIILKSTASKGGIEKDFDSEWEELIIKTYKPTEAPLINKAQPIDNGQTKSGVVKYSFNKSEALVMLMTFNGYNRCASVVATTNSEEYLPAIAEFVGSVKLVRPDSISQPINGANTINSAIIGIWRRGQGLSTSGGSYGRWKYIAYQYTFNANGTYNYIIKTYVEDDKETLLTRESGIYSVNGNNVALNPQTNVIEAWSKKNGGDNYNQLLSSQKKPLEKTTYQYTIHYFQELKESGLVLISNTETMRDGKYNAGDPFPNGWRFSPAGPNYKPIKLPGE